MSQVDHIILNKEKINIRSQTLRTIREFFWNDNFVEIDAPAIVKLAGQEPNLEPVSIELKDENKKTWTGHLHTSPEYAMKKALAAGFEKIFFLGKCYRNQESFGGLHNPEFTMLEWYRTNTDMNTLMIDCEIIIRKLQNKINTKTQISKIEKKTMKELWKEVININLDEYLNHNAIFDLCKKRNYQAKANESYAELFYRIFLNEIEPSLNNYPAIIIQHFPAQLASLAKLSKPDPRYAQRFELYINGIEIANAFSELTDAKEQKRRLTEERKERKKTGKSVYDIDEDFIKAVDRMPKSAGIALGVDRLIQVLIGCKNINDLLILPLEK